MPNSDNVVCLAYFSGVSHYKYTKTFSYYNIFYTFLFVFSKKGQQTRLPFAKNLLLKLKKI